jgi:pimeloyl-ACP methyl ester carboxylesterase
MHVLVNGVRLFFDVEGGRLVPDGPAMREKPTLLLLHGGPGLDHSIYRPAFSGLSDVAQVVFLDHRGNGRSDPGPRESWTLAQWADDVHAFCETLGIARPIVYGASFGGTVALAYATRHPEHPGKLILVSAEAAADTHLDRRVALFERSVDPRSARWRAAGSSRARATRTPRRSRPGCAWPFRSHANAARSRRRQACCAQSRGHALVHAAGRGGAHVRFRAPDLTRTVSDPRARGEDDPMTPIECQADIAAALPAHLVRFERFAGCGHAVVPDAPERAMAVIRDFIAR